MLRRSAWRSRALACVAALAVAAGCGPVTGAPPSPAIEVSVTTGLADALTFEPPVITLPARTTVRLTLTNVSAQAHNLTFQEPIAGGTRTIVEAGAADSVTITTPGPGAYPFVCTIHLDMTGTLTVT